MRGLTAARSGVFVVVVALGLFLSPTAALACAEITPVCDLPDGMQRWEFVNEADVPIYWEHQAVGDEDWTEGEPNPLPVGEVALFTGDEEIVVRFALDDALDWMEVEGVPTDEPCGSITIVKVSESGDRSFPFASKELGNFELTTVEGTDSTVFTPLGPATYVVAENTPAGWTLADLSCVSTFEKTVPTSGATATITLEFEEAVTCTYTNRAAPPPGPPPEPPVTPPPPAGTAAIGDYVWHDADADGVQDDDEVGLGGVAVELMNGTGTAVLAQQVTDGFGKYRFSDLAADSYRVRFVLPDVDAEKVEQFTLTGVGPKDLDSDAGSGGMSEVIGLSDGEVDLTWDAGIHWTAVLGIQVEATTTTVAEVVAETLPFTGGTQTNLGMVGLAAAALGGLVLAMTHAIRKGRHERI